MNNGNYGFYWKYQNEICETYRNSLPLVTEDTSKSIDNSSTNNINILFEGENYYALNFLLYTHREKIDVIYIDPPYNNPNNNTTYRDSEDHSMWISKLYRRLLLSKELLLDEGIMYISIDHTEYAQVKHLCDSIFNNNYITTFCWVKSTETVEGHILTSNPLKVKTGNLGSIKLAHEYVLCYGKNHKNLPPKIHDIPSNRERFTKRGNPMKTIRLKKGIKCTSKNYTGTIKNIINEFEPIEILNPEGIVIQNGELKNDIILKGPFYNVETVNNFTQGKVTPNVNGKKIHDLFITSNGNPKIQWSSTSEIPSTILSGYGDTSSHTKKIEDLIGIELDEGLFPKPVAMIKHLIKLATNKTNAIVLDFFAGSGTTGQATLELNAEDDCTHQFILCTNNEPFNKDRTVGICTKICYPRLDVLMNNKKATGEGSINLSGNLRYYKISDPVDFIMLDNNYIPNDFLKNILMLKENTHYQLLGVANLYAITDEKRKLVFLTFKFHESQDYINQINQILSSNQKYKQIKFYIWTDDYKQELSIFNEILKKFDISNHNETILLYDLKQYLLNTHHNIIKLLND